MNAKRLWKTLSSHTHTHTHKLFICIGEANTGVHLHRVCLPRLSVLDRSWFGLQFTCDSVSFSLLQIMKESAARTLFTNRKTHTHTHTGDTVSLYGMAALQWEASSFSSHLAYSDSCCILCCCHTAQPQAYTTRSHFDFFSGTFCHS